MEAAVSGIVSNFSLEKNGFFVGSKYMALALDGTFEPSERHTDDGYVEQPPKLKKDLLPLYVKRGGK